jgi:hypothetical protein
VFKRFHAAFCYFFVSRDLRRCKILRFVNIVFIFLLVAPILRQSQNHPVADTLYAPLYHVQGTTVTFIGWEGADGTYIKESGEFYDSITYDSSVQRCPLSYVLSMDVETFSILGFKYGSVVCSIDGSGLPNFVPYVSYPPVNYEFQNPEPGEYPMPPSSRNEYDQFIQRVYFKLVPSTLAYDVDGLRASHMNRVEVTGNLIPSQYKSGNSYYYRIFWAFVRMLVT